MDTELNDVLEGSSNYSHRSRMSFQECEPDQFTEITNATIVMIDIAGFSKWCANQTPRSVVETMIAYNKLLVGLLPLDKPIFKIELVGDCCMVAGMPPIGALADETCIECVRYGYTILENLPRIRRIFRDNEIGVRIGIHCAHVFGVVIEHPNRFQLFGNDINICSRLMDAAVKNTIHLSLKTLTSVQGLCSMMCGPCAKTVRGPRIHQDYKGVGELYSYMLHLRLSKILILTDIYRSVTTNTLSHIDMHICTTIPEFESNLYSHFWNCVVIITMTDEIKERLQRFRRWEREQRRPPQLLITVGNVHDCTLMIHNVYNLNEITSDFIQEHSGECNRRSSLDIQDPNE